MLKTVLVLVMLVVLGAQFEQTAEAELQKDMPNQVRLF
jgi:hypothetical protein